MFASLLVVDSQRYMHGLVWIHEESTELGCPTVPPHCPNGVDVVNVPLVGNKTYDHKWINRIVDKHLWLSNQEGDRTRIPESLLQYLAPGMHGLEPTLAFMRACHVTNVRQGRGNMMGAHEETCCAKYTP